MDIKENINNVEEYNFLYDNVGWGHYDYEISKVALENTIYSVSIYENKEIIGYGRMVGDGAVFLYIQDIMVREDWQNKKVGTKIMNLLIQKIKEYKKINPILKVYLGAAKGKEGFYEKFNFITRKDAGLGEGMILKQ